MPLVLTFADRVRNQSRYCLVAELRILSLFSCFCWTARLFNDGDVALVLCRSIHLFVQNLVSLVHLEFETFDCLPAFTIVTNEFDSSFFASVEFVLGEEDLSSAPRAFLSHHTSDEVVQL